MLFAVDAITTAMFGIVLWVALPETRPAVPAHDSADGGAVRAILRDHLFLAVCLLTLGFCLVFFQAFVGLPIDMRAHGISTSGFGGLIAINGVLVVMLQLVAGELIRDRSRPLVLALASLVLGLGSGLNAWVGTALGYAGAIACGQSARSCLRRHRRRSSRMWHRFTYAAGICFQRGSLAAA